MSGWDTPYETICDWLGITTSQWHRLPLYLNRALRRCHSEAMILRRQAGSK